MIKKAINDQAIDSKAMIYEKIKYIIQPDC